MKDNAKPSPCFSWPVSRYGAKRLEAVKGWASTSWRCTISVRIVVSVFA